MRGRCVRETGVKRQDTFRGDHAGSGLASGPVRGRRGTRHAARFIATSRTNNRSARVFLRRTKGRGCVMHGSAVRRRSPVRSRAFDRDRVLPDTAFERITPRGINRARADVIAAAPRDRPPNFSPLVPVIRPVSPPNFVKNHIRKMRPYASRPLTVHRPFFHLTGRGSRRGGSQGCRQEGAQEG